MSTEEDKVSKLYYSIGEVAEMFNVNTSLIRFWEKEFDIIKPKKNKKGNRYFKAKDIDNFKRIFQLVKEEGYTLDGAKAKLKSGKLEKDLFSQNDGTSDHASESNLDSAQDLDNLIEKLEFIRAELLSLRENL